MSVETYGDACRIADEDRREECPNYLMGLCSKWPGEPCPIEAEDEYRRFYRPIRGETGQEDVEHRPGKMTDQEAIDILNNYKIDCSKPGAFKVIAAISVAVSCLEERKDRHER